MPNAPIAADRKRPIEWSDLAAAVGHAPSVLAAALEFDPVPLVAVRFEWYDDRGHHFNVPQLFRQEWFESEGTYLAMTDDEAAERDQEIVRRLAHDVELVLHNGLYGNLGGEGPSRRCTSGVIEQVGEFPCPGYVLQLRHVRPPAMYVGVIDEDFETGFRRMGNVALVEVGLQATDAATFKAMLRP